MSTAAIILGIVDALLIALLIFAAPRSDDFRYVRNAAIENRCKN